MYQQNVVLMVIYKGLFRYRNQFSGCEAILYSTLVSHSLWQYGEVFDGKGEFDMNFAKDYLEVCEDDNGYSYIDLPYFTCSTLSKTLKMSERNIRYTLKSLRQKRIISDKFIYCPKWLIESGYLKLPDNTNLKGWQLVFYALLKNRSDYFGGSMDTWAYKIAEMFYTTPNNVYFLINVLKNKGYVRRGKDNKLLVK